jgi:hypothetical protein
MLRQTENTQVFNLIKSNISQNKQARKSNSNEAKKTNQHEPILRTFRSPNCFGSFLQWPRKLFVCAFHAGRTGIRCSNDVPVGRPANDLSCFHHCISPICNILRTRQCSSATQAPVIQGSRSSKEELATLDLGPTLVERIVATGRLGTQDARQRYDSRVQPPPAQRRPTLPVSSHSRGGSTASGSG